MQWRTLRYRLVGAAVLGAFALVLLAQPAVAGEGDGERARALKILRGLQHGIESLRALGGHKEVIEQLGRIHQGLERRLGHGQRAQAEKRGKRHGGEAEGAREHLEILRMAIPALLESDRRDLAEQVELAMRALRPGHEGRSDAEAAELRERAPAPGQLAEILGFAAQKWREFKNPEKAEHLEALSKRLLEAHGEGWGERRHREGPEAPGHLEDPAVRLQTVRLARKALLEADRHDAAEALGWAIHLLELMVEGKQEALMAAAQERRPDLGQVAELLSLSGRLWREFDRPDKAERVEALARLYAERSRGEREEREHGEREEGEHEERGHAEREHEEREREEGQHEERERAEAREHLEHLHRQVMELREAMEHIQEQLEELAHRMR